MGKKGKRDECEVTLTCTHPDYPDSRHIDQVHVCGRKAGHDAYFHVCRAKKCKFRWWQEPSDPSQGRMR